MSIVLNVLFWELFKTIARCSYLYMLIEILFTVKARRRRRFFQGFGQLKPPPDFPPKNGLRGGGLAGE